MKTKAVVVLVGFGIVDNRMPKLLVTCSKKFLNENNVNLIEGQAYKCDFQLRKDNQHNVWGVIKSIPEAVDKFEG